MMCDSGCSGILMNARDKSRLTERAGLLVKIVPARVEQDEDVSALQQPPVRVTCLQARKPDYLC